MREPASIVMDLGRIWIMRHQPGVHEAGMLQRLLVGGQDWEGCGTPTSGPPICLQTLCGVLLRIYAGDYSVIGTGNTKS